LAAVSPIETPGQVLEYLDYTRYSHQQIRIAIELNDDVIDEGVKKHLAIMPPVNAFYRAKFPAKAEMHHTDFHEVLPQTSTKQTLPRRTPALPAQKYAYYDSQFHLARATRSVSVGRFYHL